MFDFFKQRATRCLYACVAVFLLAACASPEERVEKYTASGEKRFAKGELVQANLEFAMHYRSTPTMCQLCGAC